MVEADHHAHRLLLEAEVRAPGRVTLEVTLATADAGATPHDTRVGLTITLDPSGVLGMAYLVADLPARGVVTELTMLHLLTILRRRDNPWPVDSVVEA